MFCSATLRPPWSTTEGVDWLSPITCVVTAFADTPHSVNERVHVLSMNDDNVMFVYERLHIQDRPRTLTP